MPVRVALTKVFSKFRNGELAPVTSDMVVQGGMPQAAAGGKLKG